MKTFIIYIMLMTAPLLTFSQILSLSPVIKGDFYCFDIDQTKQIAIIAVNSRVNDSIISTQEALILDYKQISIANDSIIGKQKTMLANKDSIINNNVTAWDKRVKLFDLKKEELKEKHRKRNKTFGLIVVAESILLVLVLIVK